MDQLLATMPWLAALGPVIGVFLLFLKEKGKLTGFGLLIGAIAVSAVVIGALGWAEGWTAKQWQVMPLAVLLTVAMSNLTGQTVEQVIDTVTKREDGNEPR